MILTVLSVSVGALLVVITVFQSTFAEHPWLKHKRFQRLAFGLSVLAGLLVIVTAISDALNKREEAAAQTRLQEAVEGVSTTVFPKDVAFDLDGRTASAEPAEIRFTVFAISVDSPMFGRWGATHTPNPTIGVGRIYEQPLGISDRDYIKLIAAPSVGFFHFEMELHSGELNRTEALAVPGPHLQLDDLMQRQFICYLNSPELADIRVAELRLKGARVPFIMQRHGNLWAGSTVFRPTFERYFDVKTNRRR